MEIDNSMQADDKYLSALRHQESGDLMNAERLYCELLGQYSDNCELLQRYGYVLAQVGKLPEAIHYLERAIELEPANALVYFNLGIAQDLNGDQEAAIEKMHKALTLKPDFSPAQNAIAEILLPYDNYMQMLKRFHQWLRPQNYVEIGVETGASMSLAEPPTVCLGIDPNPQIRFDFPAPTQIFSETSDDFFVNHNLYEELGGKTVGLAFIDGLHLFEAALKDFINIERHSSPDTVVLIHDCIPLDQATSERDRNTTFWSGDTWKILPALKKYRPDLNLLTLPSPPTGLAVVTGLDSESVVLSEKMNTIVNEYISLSYDYLEKGKDEILNVVYDDWPTIQERIRPFLS